jgi:serine/threonine protein kinase/regulator of sirC expression with transglutaminase-like and TPR domain
MAEQLLAGRYRVTQVKVPGKVYLASDTYRPGYPMCVVRRLQLPDGKFRTFQTTQQQLRNRLSHLTQLKRHDRIVPFAWFFEENRQLYVVEEWVQGYTLNREILVGGRFSPTKTVRLLREILEALDVIHEQNIVHGYLTPTSLIRRRSDHYLVLTNLLLGSTLRVEGDYSQGWVVQSSGSGSEVAKNCLPYLAPEQQQGKSVLSSDLYASGLIAVQALMGSSADTLVQVKVASVRARQEWAEGLGLDPRFKQWIESLIHSDWTQRPASAGMALRSLNELFPLPSPSPGSPTASKNGSGVTVAASYKEFDLNPLPSSSNGHAASQNGTGKTDSGAASGSIPGSKMPDPAPSQPKVWGRVLAGSLMGVGLVGLGYGFCQMASVISLSTTGTSTGASPQRVLQVYGQAIERNPRDYRAYLKRGNLRLELGDATGAIADYSEAIAVAPKAAAPLLQRGIAYANLNNMAAALTDLDQAIRWDDKLPQAYLHRCRVHTALNKLPEAVQDCSTAINLDPSLEMAYQNRSQTHQRMGNLMLAMADLDIAIALNPTSAVAYTLRGQIRQQLGDETGAMEDVQQAIKLAPDYGLAYYHRGLLRLGTIPDNSAQSDRHVAQQDLQTAASHCLSQGDFACYQMIQTQLKKLRHEHASP